MSKHTYTSVAQPGFTQLIQDYVDQKPQLRPFITDFPTKDNVLKHLSTASFSPSKRNVLVEALKAQYHSAEMELPSSVDSLIDENTFVVTTGHQLSLYGGAKYFIHKIISTIQLSRVLNASQNERKVLPLFWMATEDHDYYEINSFKQFGSQISSTKSGYGPMGRVSPEVFEETLSELKTLIGSSVDANFVYEIFKKSFDKKNWADATRYWVQQLFGEELIIIDGDDTSLKQLFIPQIKDELMKRKSNLCIEKTSETLIDMGYHKQVGQREINLFYIEDGIRERIYAEGNMYYANNTDISWSESELLQLVDSNPEKFSPNATLRPLFEEVILPNIAYIGGPGELAYWFQLKHNFDRQDVPFPMLILRDSFALVSEKDLDSLNKLKLNFAELGLPQNELIHRYLELNTVPLANFDGDKNDLSEVQKSIMDKTLLHNSALEKMMSAEFHRWNKLFTKLDKKLTRELKDREEVNLNRVEKLSAKYFPKGKLNERSQGFIDDLLILGNEDYLSELFACSNVWISDIKIISV
jgi:bacillithiol biosynthesis cysteine-adding enzyme BshC